MFDSPIAYKFVQKDSNKHKIKSYKFIHVYKFYIHKSSSLRKYIVKITEYHNELFTVEFYAKIKDRGLSDNRYNVLTNQMVMGRVGATVLSIIAEIAQNYNHSCFGIAAAPLKNEKSDNFTKRCRVYSLILSYTTKERNSAFDLRVIKEKSHIIVRKKFSLKVRRQKLKEYEKIFNESY